MTRYSLAALALLFTACAAEPVLLPDASTPDAGPCGGACGAGTVCAAGACVAIDAGAVDVVAQDLGGDAGVDASVVIDRPAPVDAPIAVTDAGVDAGVVDVSVARDSGSDVLPAGCDASVANDPANCGACGVACAAGARCVSGRCTASLIGDLGGPSGFGPAENCLPPLDDGTFRQPDGGAPRPISLGPSFAAGLSFYGRTYTSLYVESNGILSFGNAYGAYSSVAFPSATRPTIAPFWSDVDTTGGGQPTINSICYALTASRVIVTWHNVGRFSALTDRLNDFQAIITARPDVLEGAFDVEFRYSRCEWFQGTAGDNAPAQAGFDAGDRMRFLALPGSRTPSVLNLCTTSNVGLPGVWRFESRATVVQAAR